MAEENTAHDTDWVAGHVTVLQGLSMLETSQGHLRLLCSVTKLYSVTRLYSVTSCTL